MTAQLVERVMAVAPRIHLKGSLPERRNSPRLCDGHWSDLQVEVRRSREAARSLTSLVAETVVGNVAFLVGDQIDELGVGGCPLCLLADLSGSPSVVLRLSVRHVLGGAS